MPQAEREANDRSPPEDFPWEAELLRVTAFPAQPLRPHPVPLWQAIVGTSAAEVVERPNLGYRHERGPWGPGVLNITQQAQRTDLLLTSPERATIVTEAPSPASRLLVRVGVLTDVLPDFLPLARKWLTCLGPLGRLAYGLVLIHEVPDRRQGYLELERLLPSIEIDVDGMRDILWQINRPRQSNVIPRLEINRLSKWNVANVRFMEMQLHPGQVRTGSPGTGEFATRVELDINTSPDYVDPLPATDLVEIFDELVAFAEGIATYGDRP